MSTKEVIEASKVGFSDVWHEILEQQLLLTIVGAFGAFVMAVLLIVIITLPLTEIKNVKKWVDNTIEKFDQNVSTLFKWIIGIAFAFCMLFLGEMFFMNTPRVEDMKFYDKWVANYVEPYLKTLPVETYEVRDVYEVKSIGNEKSNEYYVSYSYQKNGKTEYVKEEKVKLDYEEKTGESTISYVTLPEKLGRNHEKGDHKDVTLHVAKDSSIWGFLMTKTN